MTAPIRELTRTDLPRALVYATGLLCGVLVAMAVQVLLHRSGIELAGVWQNLLSSNPLQLRSAGAWWLLAGSAFLVGAATGAALSRMPLPWRQYRLLRWCLGAGLVFALAEVGHIAMAATARGTGAHAAVSLATLAGAALMALFGAYFAARR